MKELTYVTGNYGKYISVKEKFERENISIDYLKWDLDEPNVNDIEFISKEKARQAFDLLGSPVFVIDSGFYIKNYPNNPNFPGAFVKRSGISTDIDRLLDTMKAVTDRRCQFVDCLTFYDGEKFYTFYGISRGNLSTSKRGDFGEKRKSNLWYVFIPDNHNKTLAEMTDEERNNRQDGHTSAIEQFLSWYRGIYLKMNQKQKVLK